MQRYVLEANCHLYFGHSAVTCLLYPYDVMMSAAILPDIDVHDLVILSQVCRLNAAHGQDPGTVDQDIQPAEASDCLLHSLPHRFLIGEVSRNKQRLHTLYYLWQVEDKRKGVGQPEMKWASQQNSVAGYT